MKIELKQSELELIADALKYSKPIMDNYPEPRERHAKALQLVRWAIGRDNEPRSVRCDNLSHPSAYHIQDENCYKPFGPGAK